jgi:hypothetical protein
MATFSRSESALGYFWRPDAPEKKWAGRVYLDLFPRLELHSLNETARQAVRQPLVLGITDQGDYVTLFEATWVFGKVSIKQDYIESINVTANYMLVGNRHFDASPSIRRVTFSSAVVEHVLRFQALHDYTEIRHRRTSGGDKIPVLRKQVSSYVDSSRRIRVRVLRSTVPNVTIEPQSGMTIDFLDLVTPKEALRTLHELRMLLTLLCGERIDLWSVTLFHKHGAQFSYSDAFFADWVEQPSSSRSFPMAPLVDISKPKLFRKIIGNWLHESDVQKLWRGAFISILDDKGTLRFSHLRELVTLIESWSRVRELPMPKESFQRLKAILLAQTEKFAAKSGVTSWLPVLVERIGHLNSYNARVTLEKFISALPSGVVSTPPSFAKDVIALRNKLVHDISLIDHQDYNRLSFMVAKLQGLYALADAGSLGAEQSEIIPRSRFLLRAENTTINTFERGSDDDL